MTLISPRLFIKILEQLNLDESEIDDFFSYFYGNFKDEVSFEIFIQFYITYLLINKKFDEFKQMLNYDFVGLDDYINRASAHLCVEFSFDNTKIKEFTPLDINNKNNVDGDYEIEEHFNFFSTSLYSRVTEQIFMLKNKRMLDAFMYIYQKSPNNKVYNNIFTHVFWSICDDERKYRKDNS